MVVSPNNSGTSSVRATLRNIGGQLTDDQWRRLSFYVGVPFILGFYGAMNNYHNLPGGGHVGYLVFYMAHAMIPWWISCVSTQLVTIALAPLRWPLTIRLLLGGAIAGFAVLPYASWLADSSAIGGQHADSAFGLFSREFFIYSLRATLIWVGINLLFDRFLGLPRYRYPAVDIPRQKTIQVESGRIASADADATEVTEQSQDFGVPAVLQLAPVPVSPDQLLAMCAEEHYVKLFTTKGDFLVYHRFSDAVKEVRNVQGMRVHRSHWVAENAVRQVCRSAKKMFVEIDGGMRIPVSRPYQAMVAQLADDADLPVFGLTDGEVHIP